MGGSIDVLYVADRFDAVEALEREEELDVHVETSVENALEGLSELDVDCVVSAHDLPDRDGLEFLRTIREKRPALPFVLFPENGSEAIASRAVANDVTEYLPDTGERERFARLAERVRDAVEERRSAEPTTTYRRRFRAVFEDPQMLVGLLDPDGTLLEANRTAMEYVEADREAVVGERFWETPWWTEEVRDDVQRWVERAANGEYVEYEADLTRPDGDRYAVSGTVRPVTAEGEVVSLIVSARDVTERESRERELELKDRAMDEAPIGILLTDPSRPDNPIVYANDQFERVTGHAREDVLDRNPDFLWGEGTDPDAMAEIRTAIDERRPASVLLRSYRDDGTRFWNRVTIAPVRDDDGEMTHFVWFHRDVTERKRREQRLQVLYRILRHNLRNGVNVIDGYAAQIPRRLPDAADDEVEEVVGTVREAAGKLADIAEKTRRLKRIDAAEQDRTMGVGDLFDRVRKSVRAEHAEGSVEVDPPDVDDVEVPRLLVVALSEAVENAIEHSDRRDPRVELVGEIQTEAGSRHVELRVADRGPGIPENEREPIETGEETSLEHASSVGLWLIKWTARTLGGELSIEENEPRGSVVTITVPAYEGSGASSNLLEASGRGSGR